MITDGVNAFYEEND